MIPVFELRDYGWDKVICTQLRFLADSPLWRSLRHRNYRLYLTGQLISVCGTWMQQVAQSWLVYGLTGSATLLGVVGFATQIPVFALGAIGGGTVCTLAGLVFATQLPRLRAAASPILIARGVIIEPTIGDEAVRVDPT